MHAPARQVCTTGIRCRLEDGTFAEVKQTARARALASRTRHVKQFGISHYFVLNSEHFQHYSNHCTAKCIHTYIHVAGNYGYMSLNSPTTNIWRDNLVLHSACNLGNMNFDVSYPRDGWVYVRCSNAKVILIVNFICTVCPVCTVSLLEKLLLY